MNRPSQPKGEKGDLEIVEERTMMAIPRGAEELRFRFVRARKPDGSMAAWHDLRLWWQGRDSEWHAGSKGISIRTSELRPLLEALTKATGGAATPAAPPAPAAQRELLPHEFYDRRAGRDPR